MLAHMRSWAPKNWPLIDSDDLWHPDKSRLQMEWLRARPEYGMVLCDVRRVEVFNDHLNEGRDRSRSDHGFVRALLRLRLHDLPG